MRVSALYRRIRTSIRSRPRTRFPSSTLFVMERDFGLTVDERDLVGLARKWADERAGPLAARFEEERRFPRELFAELGEMGFGGIPYAERYGGGGQTYLLYLCVVEEV